MKLLTFGRTKQINVTRERIYERGGQNRRRKPVSLPKVSIQGESDVTGEEQITDRVAPSRKRPGKYG